MNTTSMGGETFMQIGELARRTGVDVETIRYYEKQALLPLPARTAGGYRIYSQVHLERLSFVRHCRALDIPIADIHKLLAALDSTDPAAAGNDVDSLLEAQLARVRARLQSMHALEQQLLRLRERCDHQHHEHPCGILSQLVAAAHGEACACHEDTNAAPLTPPA